MTMYCINYRHDEFYSIHDRHHCSVCFGSCSAHCSAHKEDTKTEG